MRGKEIDGLYSDEETARRRDEALLRALNTPPKPHSAMKLGKRKAKTNPPKKRWRLKKERHSDNG